VDFKPDTVTTYADVQIVDENNSSVSWAGQWRRSAGVDDIVMNDHYVRGYSSERRHNTMAHELGHALGLGDHTDGAWRGTLMYGYTGLIQAPQAHDKADYQDLWG
jgi:hypothetical protein